jgi:hypothetical protein
MKKHIYLLLTLIILGSCSKEDGNQAPGNPVIEPKSEFSAAMFGDSLSFTVGVNDEIPLSTLKVNLYFGDEAVSQTVIRTKDNGDYTGKIYIPYYPNIPNGKATLEFVLQNTNLTTVKKEYDLAVSRPDYPYLILVAGDVMYPMEKTGSYEYTASELFPSTDLPAYIKTPVISEWGNEMTFGWEEGAITHGSKTEIPFVSPVSGKYPVTFNTYTYKASPFFEIFVNDQKMDMIDKTNFKIELNLTNGQEINVEGIDNISSWWIDPDFFTKVSDTKFTFLPVAGKYRITANTALKYFRVEVMSGNDLATLQADGTGAIWVIGVMVGKPTIGSNEVGWNTDNGLCMAPIGNKKYQITFLSATTNTGTNGGINRSFNFKFFHQRGWGGEFISANLSTTSAYAKINPGPSDDGNILPGTTALTVNRSFVFVIDVSAGINNAVLTVTRL